MKQIFLKVGLCALLSATAGAAERPGKAVFATSELGMKLTAVALQNIGVKTTRIDAVGQSIPTSAVVHYQDRMGVYRLREGWFKLIPIDVGAGGGNLRVDPKDFKAGDEIVVRNAGLLRVAEMDAFGSEE